jgi:hypothetical protein
MSSVVLFGGPQALDFLEVRSSIMRIPEVRSRLEAAQEIWDQHVEQVVDLHQFLCSEDKDFFNNLSLKSLCSAIVQIGLYDRLKRQSREPDFLVGDCRNDSALKVISGTISFFDLIVSSRAAGIVHSLDVSTKKKESLSLIQGGLSGGNGLPGGFGDSGTMPLLNGQTFALYEVLARRTVEGQEVYSSMSLQDMDISKLVKALYDKHDVRQLITVGPGQSRANFNSDGMLADMKMSESIDLDPMLNWFWRGVREVSVGA